MARSRITALTAVVTLLLASAAPVAASVVAYDSFGPFDSMGDSIEWVGGPNDYSHAMRFRSSQTGLLDQVSYGVAYLYPGSNTWFQYRVALYSDFNPDPGNVLPSLGQLLASVTVSHRAMSDEILTVDFAGAAQLESGRNYWLALEADNNMLLGWRHNDISRVGVHAFFNCPSFEDIWSYWSGDPVTAFRVTTVVPVPASAWLLGSALGTILGLRRAGRRDRRVSSSR